MNQLPCASHPGNHSNDNTAANAALPPASDDGFAASVIQEISVLGEASLQQGARMLVMRELLRSLCSHLPASTRTAVTIAFRLSVEDLMAKTDDHPMPDSFHTALLSEVNGYLDCLR
ncbi:hypothetical protein D9M68_464670 [compost metagenome]